jgi:hypothetical protein
MNKSREPKGFRFFANKNYSGKNDRSDLEEEKYIGDIMYKALRNRKLTRN